MAKGKYTYDDMFELVKEIERGAKDKSRTLNSVTNPAVKDMLADEASMALSAGVTEKVLLGGVGAAVATSTLVGSISGAGSGAVATGVTALGVHAFSATAGGAIVGGVAGGSLVSIPGIIIGAVIGLVIGLVIGAVIKGKNAKKKEILHQEVEQKQNTVIRDLEREFNEFKEVVSRESLEKDERYRYIISLLMANEELRKAV